MLDERALRKPNFSPGAQVELADGQLWTFPKPKIRFTPAITGESVSVQTQASFGPETDDLLDLVWGVVPAPPLERLRAKFTVAVRLLLANYNLQPDDLTHLLALEPGDPRSEARWDQIGEVLSARSPKLWPAI
jgi:hypothetical protein